MVRLQGANGELKTEISNLNIFQNDSTDFKLELKNIEQSSMYGAGTFLPNGVFSKMVKSEKSEGSSQKMELFQFTERTRTFCLQSFTANFFSRARYEISNIFP